MSTPTRCVLVFLALLVSWSVPLRAHDIYTGLTNNKGVSCCHDQDCRPAPYRMTPAGVEMLLYGKWIAVPAETIQYRVLSGDTGETGGGHWCGYELDQRIRTLCVILPPNSAGLSVRGRP